MRIRTPIFELHLIAGLAVAIFLIILGVTGSVMVFEEQIDRALNPKLSWVEPQGNHLSLSELKVKLEAAKSGSQVIAFGFSRRDDVAWSAVMESQEDHKPFVVYFNQYTGGILGTAAERNDFVNTIHQFHIRL